MFHLLIIVHNLTAQIQAIFNNRNKTSTEKRKRKKNWR